MNPSYDILAHAKGRAKDTDEVKWQSLSVHSLNVAALASSFAAPFNSQNHAWLLGMLHDLGKVRSSFQSYIRRCNGIEETEEDFGDHAHSGVGACWLAENVKLFGKALAYCVAGHHAGLADWSRGKTPLGSLVVRLNEDKAIMQENAVSVWIADHKNEWFQSALGLPFQFKRNDSSVSFWIRMLYSCLVDADFLDTEAFLDPGRSALRSYGKPLEALAPVFFSHLSEKQRLSEKTEVNLIRADIRAACENAADLPPGLFSLTVPTGGGKTLSGTAFAFRHALKHGFKRIIYVIPYTSIIEQTADILRGILGNENVLEHHSNFDPDKETPQSRLASENWDAPIIVTTSVQFFESLYACKSSHCRKLHNIAESVVILDEVQLLPTKLLLPCAEAICQLIQHYRSSIVLSTATQLNLPGIDPALIREIASPGMDLYRRLKRTQIIFPENRSVRRTWQEIADELSSFERILCVVNTRRDCRILFDKMPPGTIHLSALMCGEHRSRTINEIKTKLTQGAPVRVVSTQLVEAGVDIDFPIVYRAFTGLASIAQSAGRCNREGRLAHPGRVVVFMPPDQSPNGELLQGEYAMSDLLNRPGIINPDSPEVFPQYYDALHTRVQDMGTAFEKWLGIPVPPAFRNGTEKDLAEPMQYQFREAADAFRMIDDASVAVIVRYEDADDWLVKLRTIGPKRDIMRRLQRYVVNIPRRRLIELIEKGLVEELGVPPRLESPSGIFVQTMPSAYSETFGLDLFRDGISIEDNVK